MSGGVKPIHLVYLGAGAVAIYLLYKLLAKGTEVVAAAADTVIAAPIAYVVASLILPPELHVPGGVVFADGGFLSFDSIINAGSRVGGDGTFVWQGVRYRVTSRRPDNNYGAVRA